MPRSTSPTATAPARWASTSSSTPARSAAGRRPAREIAGLRYGTIAVNAWTGVGFLTARATWGAFPGHPLDDIGAESAWCTTRCCCTDRNAPSCAGRSGRCPALVMTGEFSLTPKPPWFVTNRTAATTGRRLVAFAARPRWSALPAIFTSALRG